MLKTEYNAHLHVLEVEGMKYDQKRDFFFFFAFVLDDEGRIFAIFVQ